MKKNTRYLSIFLAIIMVLTMMPFSTIGANAVTNVPTISIEASDDTATVGDVITLTVKTTENSELVIVSGIISYDSDCFEVIPDSKTYPQGGLCEINTKTEGKVKFAYVSVAPLADNETNVFSINFKVLKTNGVIDLDVKEVYVLDGNTEVNVTKQAGSSVEPLTITCKHSYSLVSETNATCTVDGVKKYVCSLCEDEYEEVVSAFGHTIVAVDAKAPTCTETGNEAYEYCPACDYTTYKEIPSKGHTIVTVDAKNPTCTEVGNEAYEYCSVCDYTTYKELPSKGHTIVTVDAKNPTCTEIGNKAYEYCSVCDYTTYKEIPSTGHTIVTVDAKDPTCTEIGNKAYEYCTVCDYTTYKEIPSAGHGYNAVVTDPTCIKQGFTTYTCVCGDCYVADETPAIGHTTDDMVVENTSNATCGTPGSYDEVVYCAVCGAEISRETKTTEKLPHAYTSKITTAPTCTETGVKTFTCSVCGEAYTTSLNATGHTIVTVDAKAPTCTEIGNEAYEYCLVCDYTTYKEIPSTGHTIVTVNAKAPTCTEVGNEAYEYCSVCDYTTYKEITSTGHSYNAVVTVPTCTEQGFTTYTCACGDSYVDDYVDANGHADNDGDGYCDADNELLDPTVECECNCHKSGITKFFFDFILFFQRIFGSNKTCACGIEHY